MGKVHIRFFTSELAEIASLHNEIIVLQTGSVKQKEECYQFGTIEIHAMTRLALELIQCS